MTLLIVLDAIFCLLGFIVGFVAINKKPGAILITLAFFLKILSLFWLLLSQYAFAWFFLLFYGIFSVVFYCFLIAGIALVCTDRTLSELRETIEDLWSRSVVMVRDFEGTKTTLAQSVRHVPDLWANAAIIDTIRERLVIRRAKKDAERGANRPTEIEQREQLDDMHGDPAGLDAASTPSSVETSRKSIKGAKNKTLIGVGVTLLLLSPFLFFGSDALKEKASDLDYKGALVALGDSDKASEIGETEQLVRISGKLVEYLFYATGASGLVLLLAGIIRREE